MVNIPLFIGFQPSVWWFIGFHSHRMLDMLGSMRKNCVDCLLSKFDPGRVVAVRSCWRRSDLWVWDPGDNMFWWNPMKQTTKNCYWNLHFYGFFTRPKDAEAPMCFCMVELDCFHELAAPSDWWIDCGLFPMPQLPWLPWLGIVSTTNIGDFGDGRNQVLMEKLGEFLFYHPW